MHMYMYMYMYVCVSLSLYIYIYRERENNKCCSNTRRDTEVEATACQHAVRLPVC